MALLDGDRVLAGIVPPLCTPLADDGEVDRRSLERHLEFLLGAGVDGLFALGSTGEVAYLTDDQRDLVLETTVAVAAGAVPVIAGVIDMTTPRMVAHARRARALGADAVVATIPFYARAGAPDEVTTHYRTLRDKGGLPVIAYDLPPAVNGRLDAEVALALAAEGTVSAIKDSSNDPAALRTLVDKSRQVAGCAVLTGADLSVDLALYLGADGGVPGLANVDPHTYVALYAAARRGDLAAVRAAQARLVELFSITTCTGREAGSNSPWLGGFKTALALRQIFATNVLACPQRPFAPRDVAAVRAVLERSGLV